MDKISRNPIKNIAVTAVISAGLIISLSGCGEKKEKQAQGPAPAEQAVSAQAPSAPAQAMPASPAGGQKPEGHPAVDASDVAKHQVEHAGMKGQKEVRLSDAVKLKWKEAKLKIYDNSSKQSAVIDIKVGSTVKLDKDGYRLKLDAVVPDYAMGANTIESRSNEPKNPAVLLTLYSGDKAVAKGWVFSAMPDFNSFKSDRFSVALESPSVKIK